MTDEVRLKIVLVGDGNTGKTVLLFAYMKQGFDEAHIPTVLDTYHTKGKVGDLEVVLEIFDTAGQEDFAQIRTLVYPGTNVFMMCYSCVLLSSVVNVRKFWAPEIHQIHSNTPILLVGNKVDLKKEDPTKFVEESEIQDLLEEGGLQGRKNFKGAMRCSAKIESEGGDGNVQNVFNRAIAIGVKNMIIDDPPFKWCPLPCCTVL